MTTAPEQTREQIIRYIESEADRMKHPSQRRKARDYRALAGNIRARFDEVDDGEV